MVIFLRDYIEVGIESIALLLKLTDGSPSGYYYSKSTVDDTNKWFIFQQGGGWCYDETSCWLRWNIFF